MDASATQAAESPTANGQSPTPNPVDNKPLPEQYQEAVLKSGIQAANLLTELIELKLMPDPRAKEMADVAVEVLKLLKDSPAMQPAIEASTAEAKSKK